MKKSFVVVISTFLLLSCTTTKRFVISDEMLRPILDTVIVELQDSIEDAFPIAVWWCDDDRFKKAEGDKEFVTSISYWVQGYIEQEIVKTKKYNVVTRTQLDRIFREQQFQYSGHADENTMVSIAKILGAKYLIVSRITAIDTLNIQVLNSETGKIMYLSDNKINQKKRIRT